MNSEILIIGGGVIGLSIARELHKRGVRDIVLLEQGRCGRESSWAAAGMLGPQADTDESGTFFEMMLKSGRMFPDFASELHAKTGIDIELDQSGTLNLAFTESESAKLAERFAWQRKAGLSVEKLTAAEALSAEPYISPAVRDGLFFPNDWQVDNRKLLDALRRYSDLNGINVVEAAKVDSLILNGNSIRGVVTEDKPYYAGTTVMATGAWTSLIKMGDTVIPGDLTPVRGQIACFSFAKRPFNRVLYSANGYLVPRRDGRVLAGSTSEAAGFDRAVTVQNSERLHKRAAEIVPELREKTIADEWAGLRPKAADGMPVFGCFDGIEGLVMATGHYRNGILLAPLTASLIASKIVENAGSEYLSEFSPNRFTIERFDSAST